MIESEKRLKVENAFQYFLLLLALSQLFFPLELKAQEDEEDVDLKITQLIVSCLNATGVSHPFPFTTDGRPVLIINMDNPESPTAQITTLPAEPQCVRSERVVVYDIINQALAGVLKYGFNDEDEFEMYGRFAGLWNEESIRVTGGVVNLNEAQASNHP